jgi:hypothetical protein
MIRLPEIQECLNTPGADLLLNTFNGKKTGFISGCLCGDSDRLALSDTEALSSSGAEQACPRSGDQ